MVFSVAAPFFKPGRNNSVPSVNMHKVFLEDKPAEFVTKKRGMGMLRLYYAETVL